jgi:hypothetical protein
MCHDTEAGNITFQSGDITLSMYRYIMYITGASITLQINASCGPGPHHLPGAACPLAHSITSSTIAQLVQVAIGRSCIVSCPDPWCAGVWARRGYGPGFDCLTGTLSRAWRSRTPSLACLTLIPHLHVGHLRRRAAPTNGAHHSHPPSRVPRLSASRPPLPPCGGAIVIVAARSSRGR